MKILICDDEKAYIEILKKNIDNYFSEKEIPFETDAFIDGEYLLDCSSYYDIAILDIEIGKYNGIDIAKNLKKINPHIIIFFVTAYDKYLDSAMDLNALRFLSKPLDVKRLFSSLDKAISSINSSVIEFLLKGENSIKRVYSNDIIMIEITGKTTKVMTTGGIFESCNNISFWKDTLNMSYFYSVHKSFIININFITKYERDTVVLNNRYSAPISYRKQAEFKNYMMSMMERR